MSHSNAAAVHALSASLGIPLAFDDEGICEMVVDDDTTVTLEGDPDGTTMRVNGIVGDLPDADSADALRLLLEANFNGQGTGAAALGIDHVTSEIVLGRSVDVSVLGPGGLEQALTEFVNYLSFWRKNLERLATEAGGVGGLDSPWPGDAFLRA